jgi:hypothetical protein
MTSYNPFGFSKVAYVHDLSRQRDQPQICKPSDTFCQLNPPLPTALPEGFRLIPMDFHRRVFPSRL